MAAPRLLHFRVSHYNEKVRWALDHKGVAHEREALVPGFHVARVRRLTGQNKVPVILVDGRAIFDSSRILEELEGLHPDPPLFPADRRDRERALAIQRYFDQEVAPDVRRLFWSTYLPHPDLCARMATAGAPAWKHAVWRSAFPLLRVAFSRNVGLDRAAVDRARARLPAHFDRLEAEIGPSGYLVGARFGLADLAAAAVMTAILRPPEFPYPLPEPWPPELVELRASVADRPGAAWVRGIYERHRGVSAEVAA